MDVEQQIYSEEADEKLINGAFETLLNSYLASRHRVAYQARRGRGER